MTLNDAMRSKARLSITGSTGENGRVMTPEFPKSSACSTLRESWHGNECQCDWSLVIDKNLLSALHNGFLVRLLSKWWEASSILKTFLSAKKKYLYLWSSSWIVMNAWFKTQHHFLHKFKMKLDWHAQLTWKYCNLTEVVVQATHQFLQPLLLVPWFILT